MISSGRAIAWYAWTVGVDKELIAPSDSSFEIGSQFVGKSTPEHS